MSSRKIRFKENWRQFERGEIIEPAAVLRDFLVLKNLAEEVSDDTPIENKSTRNFETASNIPESEQAVQDTPQPKRRRGRPRKRKVVP